MCLHGEQREGEERREGRGGGMVHQEEEKKGREGRGGQRKGGGEGRGGRRGHQEQEKKGREERGEVARGGEVENCTGVWLERRKHLGIVSIQRSY